MGATTIELLPAVLADDAEASLAAGLAWQAGRGALGRSLASGSVVEIVWCEGIRWSDAPEIGADEQYGTACIDAFCGKETR
jgi:hypothetical protein